MSLDKFGVKLFATLAETEVLLPALKKKFPWKSGIANIC